MLSPEEDVKAYAFRQQGWKFSRIARHLGPSRATIRAYLNNQRTPGMRQRALPDPFDRYHAYVATPHLWASALGGIDDTIDGVVRRHRCVTA